MRTIPVLQALTAMPVDVQHAPDRLLPNLQSDRVAAVREGLSYDALQRVSEALAVPDAMLARALAISERTLHRRRGQGRLSTEESDRLLLLAEVVELAVQAFDDVERARRWLRQPHALLGDEAPLEHMDTFAGVEEVRSMLYHIEYSMPV